MFGDMPLPAKFFIAFIIMLALIGGVAWLVRRYSAGGLSASSVRGRQARLGVIEAAAVDSRRRLVLVRRDNVEHLVMLGGPSDLVIEANIVRAAQASARELPPQRPAEPAGLPATGDGMWPAAPEPPLRPGRGPERPAVPPPFDELPLQPHPEPAPRVPAGDRGGADIGRSGNRPEPPMPRAMAEPHRMPAEPRRPFAATPPRAPEETHSTDRHLTAMAQQLEAALRRSGATPGRDASPELPGVRRPGAEPRPRAEAREPRSSLLERAMQARSSASFAPVRAKAAEAPAAHADAEESAAAATNAALETSPPTPDSAVAAAPAPEPAAEASPPGQQDEGQAEASAPAEDKPPASIEEEMASLLGRAPGKS